jgi:hypothetical protein
MASAVVVVVGVAVAAVVVDLAIATGIFNAPYDLAIGKEGTGISGLELDPRVTKLFIHETQAYA